MIYRLFVSLPISAIERIPRLCNEMRADELTSIARRNPVAGNPRVGDIADA